MEESRISRAFPENGPSGADTPSALDTLEVPNMPEGKVAEEPLRMIGLTRKSKGEDEGTHAAQRGNIERRIAGELELTLLDVWKEHQVSGGKSWRERELGQALEWIKAGRADGVCVDEVDRLTRERMSAAADIWDAFEGAGAVLIDCKGTDSRDEDGEFSYGLNALLARKQYKQYQRRSNAGRERAVMELGVHGGDTAPQGYDFTERPELNASGKPKHGPLTLNAGAGTITPAFEALDNDEPWSKIIRALGVKSQAAAASILRNRVYLGEARSGEFVKEGAHPPLVDADLFARVQRKLDKRAVARAQRPTDCTPHKHPNALAGVLRCAECGGRMSPQWDTRQYRCQYEGADKHEKHPNGQPSIVMDATVPVVLKIARDWHAHYAPIFMLGRAADEAIRPALVSALAEAEAEVARLEAEIGAALPADSKQKLAVGHALDALDDHEAANGWLGMSPEAVERRLASGGVEETNSFLRETVRVLVAPVGRGRKVPVAERLQVQYLGGGASVDPAVSYPALELPVPDPANILPVETAPPDQFPEAGVMDADEAARRLAELTEPHPVEVPDHW
jgi:Resolvase, N terminal domain